MAGRRATSCAATPLLNSKPYPAKHKILPLNMCGVTAYQYGFHVLTLKAKLVFVKVKIHIQSH
ncbi:hypothetical protein HanPSC8_Chr04g0180261 [Helianthus annuus]|nr:hypothetical protein HanPSC8_Chr04g0180261 [Helianthus annuus]